MKSPDIKSNTYINIDRKVNDKDLKFKVGDLVRISKMQKHFCLMIYPKLV